MAAWNTNVSAGMGVLGWTIIDMIRYKGKLSTVGACEGAIAGLVGKFLHHMSGYQESFD